MSVVFVEVNVSSFSGRELTVRHVAFDWRISMVDGDMVRYRVVSAINLSANSAHVSVLRSLDVLLVTTPTFFIIIRHNHVSIGIDAD